MNIFKRLWMWIHYVFVGKKLRKRNQELSAQCFREQRSRAEEALRKTQAQCPHLQGSNPLSVQSSSLTCIVWHYYNDMVWRGICSNCGRKFEPTDKDFCFWFNSRCGNKPSTAVEPRYGDWPNAPGSLKTLSGIKQAEANADQRFYGELDALSDDEIFALMDETRIKFNKLGCRPKEWF